MNPLRNSMVTHIRQNHALEHATMHALTRAQPGIHLVGRSDWGGFTLYGEVETATVLRAVAEALSALKHGEAWLAVHPRCGTNLATSALLMVGGLWAGWNVPTKSRITRMAAMAAAAAAASLVAAPLGMAVQRHITTTADLESVYVEVVKREQQAGIVVHRIQVAGN
ncbi:MAG: DUF6391 domain-containing protein [Anaerolineae bacterium]